MQMARGQMATGVIGGREPPEHQGRGTDSRGRSGGERQTDSTSDRRTKTRRVRHGFYSRQRISMHSRLLGLPHSFCASGLNTIPRHCHACHRGQICWRPQTDQSALFLVDIHRLRQGRTPSLRHSWKIGRKGLSRNGRESWCWRDRHTPIRLRWVSDRSAQCAGSGDHKTQPPHAMTLAPQADDLP